MRQPQLHVTVGQPSQELTLARMELAQTEPNAGHRALAPEYTGFTFTWQYVANAGDALVRGGSYSLGELRFRMSASNRFQRTGADAIPCKSPRGTCTSFVLFNLTQHDDDHGNG